MDLLGGYASYLEDLLHSTEDPDRYPTMYAYIKHLQSELDKKGIHYASIEQYKEEKYETFLTDSELEDYDDGECWGADDD